ncbi:MAG: NAD(P)(+) transhydrogenase (Re/Si-specific) subunit beta [Gemmatimonadaceae bacterium]|nr:NAD(P)(+) transhydrogenase (Re/Si-specific) subunit beta [Gemmatimonadaceae bacterium]
MSRATEQLVYLVAAVLFITGLQRLQSPATARNGNRISGVGMLIAVVATLLTMEIVTPMVIVAGLLAGSAVGFWMARTVQMTAMPQMVALLNGFGGAASLLVGGAEFLKSELRAEQIPLDTGITIQLSLLIGAVTFTGSLIAWAKLQEVMTGKPIVFAGQKALSAALALAVVGLSVYQLMTAESLLWPFYAVCAISLLLGILLVIPIGGADMPVVIALLNSYSGIAAAMTGFVIDNSVLIISGALVGSSGIILSNIMCKAMNRSLANVLFGAFGAAGPTKSLKSAAGLSVRSVSPEDAAIQLAYAQNVVVIPGYGMAVAQAQHAVREIQELIEKRGGEVKYAVHPVAGRMPGHMNVLLAEANVPYDKLRDMDDINPEMERCDVAVVIGANDVVNPGARTDTSSPIYGMPIINADHAKSIIVLKRSMAAGFAGIENELFYNPRTSMLFGDAKQSLTKVIAEMKQL